MLARQRTPLPAATTYDSPPRLVALSGGISIARRSALAAVLLALVLNSTALAVDPPRLQGSITDQTGDLASATGEIEAALDDLLDRHGVQLFVLFVDSTEDLSVTDFADETARINSLGVDDALLLVAVDDRTDAIWVSDDLPVTDAELSDVIAETLEPGLRTGDYPAAVIATAEALGSAVAPATPAPAPTTRPSAPPGGGGADSGGLDLGTIVGIVLLGLGIVVLGLWLLSKVASRRDADERDRRTGKLARDANALLIATDDRIRAAEQEAGFVEAEFGSEQAAPFRAAVAEARNELRGAFEIRQRLDDAEPEDPPTRELMLLDVVERLGRAQAALDTQAARIDELRNLERQAPEILAALPAQVEAQEARLAGASQTIGELTAAYAEPAWAAVKGNVVEATKGLAGARSAIGRGLVAVGGGAGGRGTGKSAAREIVTAQQGVAGAAALLDAIDHAARTIRETEAGLDVELAETEADLADARAALPIEGATARPEREAALAAAEQALRSARHAVAAHRPEPIGAGRATAEARRQASEVFAAIRADAAQAARIAAALEASLTSARAEVDRAEDFIGTRSGGVQRRARTRLAEAQRLLEHAELVRDAQPKVAMDEAIRADKLAEEAYTIASADFARWDRTGRGPTAPTATGTDIFGSILGGIIGGILSGGGRGAGWGGSSWGSPGGSRGPSRGGGGWGGGRSSGGSFGGFGGGGGGRSKGGRW